MDNGKGARNVSSALSSLTRERLLPRFESCLRLHTRGQDPRVVRVASGAAPTVPDREKADSCAAAASVPIAARYTGI